MTRIIAFVLLAVFALGGAAYFLGNTKKTQSPELPAMAKAPVFVADSAYQLVKKQVDFGPRVPNSMPHKLCGDWMIARLKAYGFTVQEQPFEAITYDGVKLKARNIIGSNNPTAAKRILLAAHWDTRPFADKDTGPMKDKPFDGANDGGSGVAVLLEIARNIHASPLENIGVDIIFFDAEDWGEKEGVAGDPKKLNWALGSQHWAKNLHQPGYSAYFGILVDLVGGRGSKFPQEMISLQYAPSIVRQVWETASKLGYDQYFLSQPGLNITDDHYPVNETARIPMIDIIEQQINSPQTFGAYHHTHKDNLENIDPAVMKAVGQTVMQVLYQENQLN